MVPTSIATIRVIEAAAGTPFVACQVPDQPDPQVIVPFMAEGDVPEKEPLNSQLTAPDGPGRPSVKRTDPEDTVPDTEPRSPRVSRLEALATVATKPAVPVRLLPVPESSTVPRPSLVTAEPEVFALACTLQVPERSAPFDEGGGELGGGALEGGGVVDGGGALPDDPEEPPPPQAASSAAASETRTADPAAGRDRDGLKRF